MSQILNYVKQFFLIKQAILKAYQLLRKLQLF